MIVKKIGLISSALILGVTLTHCQLGPRYTPPEAPIPETWKGESQENNESESQNVCYWWEIFEDQILNELEIEAITNNRELVIAIERVVEARALAGVKRADLYPQLTLNPSYTDSGMLFQFFLPPGVSTELAPGGITPFRIHQYQYVLPFNLSYEIDLWGKLRGQFRSAFLNAEAKLEALCTALLSLTTDLASNYFMLRSYDEQIALQQSFVEDRQAVQTLANSRYLKGLANYFETTQASIQVTQSEASLFDSRTQRAHYENQIAVLIGKPASDFSLEPGNLPYALPAVPAGLPATILTQRPDIREAERQAAAEHALIGVAYASYFPSLELTATLGYLSPDIKQFMRWISRLWILGVNFDQTLFDGGRNDENLAISWSHFRQANSNYQQKVLVAFKEVEDALSNLNLQAEQQQILLRQVEITQSAYELADKRYQKGLTNLLDALSFKQAATDAKLHLTALQGLRYVSTVQLIKSLGGGWSQVKMVSPCVRSPFSVF